MGCDGDRWWIGDDGSDVGRNVSELVPAEDEMGAMVEMCAGWLIS